MNAQVNDASNPRQRPMRILFLCNNMARGGAERQIVALATEMARRGHRVGVGVLMTFLDFRAELEAAGVETFAIGLHKKAAAPLAYPKLILAIRRFRPDVVHAHLFWAILAARTTRVGWRLGSNTGVLVCTAHTPFERTPWRYAALRATDRMSEQWTAVSEESLQIHKRERAIRAGIVVPNGIRPVSATRARNEVRRELGVAEDVFLWVSLGSLRDDQKDYPNLLQAVALGVPGQVLIAGGGPELEKLQALADALGVAKQVRFLGLRSDVPELLGAADAFVQSSWFEAFPIALLEASTAPLPIVATDVGDTKVVVLHERTGLLVPSRNPVAMAAAMRNLVKLSPATRASWARAADEHVRGRFQLDEVVSTWETMYQRLLDQRPVMPRALHRRGVVS